MAFDYPQICHPWLCQAEVINVIYTNDDQPEEEKKPGHLTLSISNAVHTRRRPLGLTKFTMPLTPFWASRALSFSLFSYCARPIVNITLNITTHSPSMGSKFPKFLGNYVTKSITCNIKRTIQNG